MRGHSNNHHCWIKASGIYLFGGIVERAIPFLLLPVIARILSARELGLLGNFQGLVYVMIPLIGIKGMDYVAVMCAKEARAKLPESVSAAVQVCVASTITAALFLLLAGRFLRHIAAVPWDSLWFCLLCCGFSFCYFLGLQIFQMHQQPIAYVALRISRAAVQLTITITLLYLGLGWWACVWGVTGANAFAALLVILVLIRRHILVITWNPKRIRALLNYCVPLIPYAFFLGLLLSCERYFITHYLGIEKNGIYSIAFQLAMAMLVITESVTSAIRPVIMFSLKEPNEGLRVARSCIAVAGFYVVCALFYGLACRLAVPSFLGASFQTSGHMVLPLSISYALLGSQVLVGLVLFFHGRTRILVVTSGIAVIVKLLSCHFLIPWLGLWGAALASIAGFLTLLVGNALAAQTMHPLPWRAVLQPVGADNLSD